MRKLKSYEVITSGKSRFLASFTKKAIREFYVRYKINKIIERKDIEPSELFCIN